MSSRCLYVSIPCGSIKSTGSGTDIYVSEKFQFLVVRLKVTPEILAEDGQKFQFLVVRLKDNRQAGNAR